MQSRHSSLAIALLCVSLSAAAASGQACGNTSVGLVPLSDLAGGSYMGFPAGLYPGGNARPEPHDTGGLRQSAFVVPRNAAGDPDPVGGKIVFISIGMSNTRNHFNQFVPLATGDPLKDPRVVVINTAQGGQSAERIDEPTDPYWASVDSRLQQAGVTREQVQVFWFLEANAGPTDPFPQHASTLRAQFESIVNIMRDRFPNGRLCYLASRIYAGYATTSLNPEPYAYEQGFSCKWLIQDQIAGDPGLNFDPGRGAVRAPWLAWGPYMWADGLVPRGDGLVWECSDFNPDGTHPSPQGSLKVAEALLDFVRSDSSASCWYRAEPPPTVFGTAQTAAAGNVPAIGWNGAPSATANDFELTLASGVPDQFSLAFFGANPARAPFVGGTRYVGFPLVRLPVRILDGTGATSYSIPVLPGMVGDTAYFQFFIRDPANGNGFGSINSDALRVCFFD